MVRKNKFKNILIFLNIKDNWYEDRLALEQPYHLEPEKKTVSIFHITINYFFFKQMRPFEISINCLNSTGLPRPLNRISRKPKHDTS